MTLAVVAFGVKLSWDFIEVGEGTPNPLDPPKYLVVKGLYRFVRNPGYLAVFAILAGEALYFGSTSLVVYMLLVVGAILPAIGGTMAKAGTVEALYVAELLGLALIWIGYTFCVRPATLPAPTADLPH